MSESTAEAVLDAPQEQPDFVGQTEFPSAALFTLFVGCVGLYALSYVVFDYFADEAQQDHTEFEVRLWALGVILVVAGIALSLLFMDLRRSPNPHGTSWVWLAGLLFTFTLLLSHLVGAWNAMPASTTSQFATVYWDARNKVGPDLSRIPAHQHRALIGEIRAERSVSGLWLFIPYLLASGFAARVMRPPARRQSQLPIQHNR